MFKESFLFSVSLLYLIFKHFAFARHSAKLQASSCCILPTRLAHPASLPCSWGCKLSRITLLSQDRLPVCGTPLAWLPGSHFSLGPQFSPYPLWSFPALNSWDSEVPTQQFLTHQFMNSHEVGYDWKPGSDSLKNYILIFGCFHHNTISLGFFPNCLSFSFWLRTQTQWTPMPEISSA